MAAILELLVDVVMEIGIRGAGYLLCRAVGQRPDPDGAVVLVVGILLWLGIAVMLYRFWASTHL